MRDISKETPSPVTFVRWLLGYLLPGIGLLVLGLITAAMAPADAIGLGGFLCFFTLGITVIAEGTKRWLGSRPSSRQKNSQ